MTASGKPTLQSDRRIHRPLRKLGPGGLTCFGDVRYVYACRRPDLQELQSPTLVTPGWGFFSFLAP